MDRSSRGPLLGPFFLLLLALAVPVAAEEYAVWFDNGESGRIGIGRLVVTAFGEDDGYRFDLDGDAFGDYFLSMRPFKCITHTDKMLCYLPYPYENRRNIDAEDLTDLEYDLLFIARSPKEYGIDPWNGRYFRLGWDDGAMAGEIHEVDLDELAVPPDEGNLRPLTEDDLTPAEASPGRWTPALRIEALD